jgi:hypothetical protein
MAKHARRKIASRLLSDEEWEHYQARVADNLIEEAAIRIIRRINASTKNEVVDDARRPHSAP